MPDDYELTLYGHQADGRTTRMRPLTGLEQVSDQQYQAELMAERKQS